MNDTNLIKTALLEYFDSPAGTDHVRRLCDKYLQEHPEEKIEDIIARFTDDTKENERDDECVLFYEKDAARLYLVADLGLFDVTICDGPEPLLVEVKKQLQPKVTAPLKIIPKKMVVGIEPYFSGVPDGFTIRKGITHSPTVPY